jgi:hypothetical protein
VIKSQLHRLATVFFLNLCLALDFVADRSSYCSEADCPGADFPWEDCPGTDYPVADIPGADGPKDYRQGADCPEYCDDCTGDDFPGADRGYEAVRIRVKNQPLISC